MTVDELIDDTWNALRPSLLRRSMLGRKRCAELVMHTLAVFPDREYYAMQAAEGSAADRRLRVETEERVHDRMRNSVAAEPGVYGFAIMSLVMMWAVSAVVQYLLAQWWKQRFNAGDFRREYGWK